MEKIELKSYDLLFAEILAFTSRSNQNTDIKNMAEDRNKGMLAKDDIEYNSEFSVVNEDKDIL